LAGKSSKWLTECACRSHYQSMTSLHIRKLFVQPLIVGMTLGTLVFVPLSAAQATTSVTKPPPNPCTSFTSQAAHAIFGVKSSVRLTPVLSSMGKGINQVRFCTITSGGQALRVVTEYKTYGFGGPFKCFKQATLGATGQICVSTVKLFHSTWGMFKKGNVYVYNAYTVTLPNKGARMYTFTLAQYKSLKV